MTILSARAASPFRVAARCSPPRPSSPRGQTLVVVDSLVSASMNGLPCLLDLRERLLQDDGDISDADATTVASALVRTLGQTLLFARLAVPDRVMRVAPDDIILVDLADLRRSSLEATLAKALEPPTSGLRAVLSTFVGPLPLPIVGDVTVLAREIVEGMTLGEVRRRAVNVQ